jgi:hypothetical protein
MTFAVRSSHEDATKVVDVRRQRKLSRNPSCRGAELRHMGSADFPAVFRHLLDLKFHAALFRHHDLNSRRPIGSASESFRLLYDDTFAERRNTMLQGLPLLAQQKLLELPLPRKSC